MMDIDQRFEQLERQTKRLRVAVVVLAAALCGVVSMAATESEIGRFDTVIAKRIFVQSDKGKILVGLSKTAGGSGMVQTFNGKTGKELVELSATVDGDGVPEDKVRTISENCRTLGFSSQGFEAE